MNPLTNTRNITKLNDREITLGITEKSSWHNQYKDSAWIFVGGLSYDLTEGDVICVFSQYGEIVNINLVRDKKTGKSMGYCFICYEDQRSTILAVDNFNGIKLCNRTIRVDHVANYRIPKEGEDIDEVTKMLREEGCAPKVIPENKDFIGWKHSHSEMKNSISIKDSKKRTEIDVKTKPKDKACDKSSKATQQQHHRNESRDEHPNFSGSKKAENKSEKIWIKDHKKSEHSFKRHKSDSDTDHSNKFHSLKYDSDDSIRHKHRFKAKDSKNKQ